MKYSSWIRLTRVTTLVLQLFGKLVTKVKKADNSSKVRAHREDSMTSIELDHVGNLSNCSVSRLYIIFFSVCCNKKKIN